MHFPDPRELQSGGAKPARRGRDPVDGGIADMVGQLAAVRLMAEGDAYGLRSQSCVAARCEELPILGPAQYGVYVRRQGRAPRPAIPHHVADRILERRLTMPACNRL